MSAKYPFKVGDMVIVFSMAGYKEVRLFAGTVEKIKPGDCPGAATFFVVNQNEPRLQGEYRAKNMRMIAPEDIGRELCLVDGEGSIFA